MPMPIKQSELSLLKDCLVSLHLDTYQVSPVRVATIVGNLHSGMARPYFIQMYQQHHSQTPISIQALLWILTKPDRSSIDHQEEQQHSFDSVYRSSVYS